MNKKGSCLCKGVKFAIVGDPEATYICTCLDCRKNSGHLGQVIGKFSSDNVIIDDENCYLSSWTIDVTESGYPKPKAFCSRCGCTIYTKPMKFNGTKIMLRTTLLDEDFDDSLIPKGRLFTKEREDYLNGADSSHFL